MLYVGKSVVSTMASPNAFYLKISGEKQYKQLEKMLMKSVTLWLWGGRNSGALPGRQETIVRPMYDTPTGRHYTFKIIQLSKYLFASYLVIVQKPTVIY